jgi:hypothetical protein
MSDRVASFHLAWFPVRRAITKLLTVPAERWEVTDTDGCVMGKVLGTSWAGTTRTTVELRRWAIYAVWRNRDAHDAFMEDSPLIKRWHSSARQLDSWLLQPVASRGSWSGINPFPDLTPPENNAAEDQGQMAVLTRAAVRLTRIPRFTRATRGTDAALQASPGCSFALGMGELPVGQQATFSIWDNADAIRAFAYEGDAHANVIRRTYRERWYSEEMFSRFRVLERPSTQTPEPPESNQSP